MDRPIPILNTIKRIVKEARTEQSTALKPLTPLAPIKPVSPVKPLKPYKGLNNK